MKNAMEDRLVTMADIECFWSLADEDTEETCIDMIARINEYGFSENVPSEIAENMLGWANAEPGPIAGAYAQQVRSRLYL